MVEIESFFFKLSILTVYYYCIWIRKLLHLHNYIGKRLQVLHWTLVNNPIKESFYEKRKKKLMFWQFFSFPIKVMSKLS